MKKILFVLVMLVSAAVGMAQESPAIGNNENVMLIERIGDTYYYNNQAMNKKDCVEFLADNSIPIYKEFHRGYTLSKKGWWLLGAGLGLEVTGSVLSIAAFFAPSEAAMATMLGLGITSIIVGTGCEIACIPVLAIGYSRMHDSVDHYTIQQRSKQRTLDLSINASQNGIGLALKF